MKFSLLIPVVQRFEVTHRPKTAARGVGSGDHTDGCTLYAPRACSPVVSLRIRLPLKAKMALVSARRSGTR